MSSVRVTVNMKETADKILRGDTPDVLNNTADTLLILNDEVVHVYMGLLTTVLVNGISEENQDIAAERIAMFDEVMEVVNLNSRGRLYKLIGKLNETIAKYEVNNDLWPSAKMRRNILSFVTDFWIWSDVERSQFLVTNAISNEPLFEADSEVSMDDYDDYDSGLEE